VLRPEPTFSEVLTAAVKDLTEHGYDTSDRVSIWVERLKVAARRSSMTDEQLNNVLRKSFSALYRTNIERGSLLKLNQGISKFTIDSVKPKLRPEIDRRIHASANMIKLNREQMVNATIKRFEGWATSVPAGGTEAINKTEIKSNIYKPFRQQSFEVRRVMIDQGHKFVANLNGIIANDGGAIALIWKSNFRQLNYDYREDHKERDGNVYLLRNSWDHQKSLVKPGKAGYYDEVTSVGQEIFCRCYAIYLYSLKDLPSEMLTAKGKEILELTRLDAA
jgi:hypothetical protein